MRAEQPRARPEPRPSSGEESWRCSPLPPPDHRAMTHTPGGALCTVPRLEARIPACSAANKPHAASSHQYPSRPQTLIGCRAVSANGWTRHRQHRRELSLFGRGSWVVAGGCWRCKQGQAGVSWLGGAGAGQLTGTFRSRGRMPRSADDAQQG